MTQHSGPQDFALDPVTAAWLKARQDANLPPVDTLPVDAARMGLETAQAQPVDKPRALSDDVTIPGGPTGAVPVRVLRPSGTQGRLPALVYMHGGGWVLGSPDTHDRLGRDLVQALNMAVVMVRYARAPEARYPVALEQCHAVVSWLAEHGEVLGLDSSRLAVGGDSSGGNLAAATAILAKRRGGPDLRSQALIYPVTDAACDTPSYERFAEGPHLTRGAMRWYWDQYCPDEADKAQDTASVLRADPEALTGLPPALVLTAEVDVLRDDGERYARLLTRAGVEVQALRLLGALHGCAAQNPLAATPPARAAVAAVAAFVRRCMA
ncbi:Carboxylesterase NlhH [Fundidesulfovibrio magnetotacticus]|uniref:Carboxylesterase NlhH n=1 Tax=Fundidesulfovibrio magnetotacticus TaxID=2730080 RepID=A0A6V8LQL7_9BACT|nr:alpha/beta hydrolase [Fundidesulfovibrio magnetotacticus]GFK92429.1 Carboxylesterase NlhH [Fundidesulfovibrio magnetotacticus]